MRRENAPLDMGEKPQIDTMAVTKPTIEQMSSWDPRQKCKIKMDHHRKNIALGGGEGAPTKEEIHIDSGMEKTPLNEESGERPWPERTTNTNDTPQPKEGSGKPIPHEDDRNLEIPGKGKELNSGTADMTMLVDVSKEA